MLQETVARFLESPPEHLEKLLVVDNASSDGTDVWLAEQKDARLEVIRLPMNSGGAGGFEAGMRHAMASFDSDWLIVTDDDGRPAPGALAAFHALDLSQWDAVASAVYFPSGEICEMNRPSRNPFWHGREFLRTVGEGGSRDGFHLSPDAYAATTGQPVDVTSFVGFFVSGQAVKTVGLPDPRLFLYGDDGLYTLGLRQQGQRIGFEPSVRFEHDCSTFGAAQRGRFRPLWKVYYYHRNLLLLYRMAAGWLFWPALLLILPKWLWKVRAHKGERRLFLKLLLRAIYDGLTGRLEASHQQVTAWAASE
mmetsp:Transcript_27513/g.50897  ORF Transcript_27513/g.50897 Transcript_27513/m.50897 type:complete len:307 (-) Transcript_27513:4054-4974(-)